MWSVELRLYGVCLIDRRESFYGEKDIQNIRIDYLGYAFVSMEYDKDTLGYD